MSDKIYRIITAPEYNLDAVTIARALFFFVEKTEFEVIEILRDCRCDEYREELKKASSESISERCARTCVQYCGICEQIGCCDNTSVAAQRITELEAELKRKDAEIERLKKEEEEIDLIEEYGMTKEECEKID